MSKKDFERNRERVYEIQGIDPYDPRYNCHHILFKSDFRRNAVIREVYGLDYLNSPENLFILPKDEHQRLHQLIEEIDRRRRR